MIKKVILNDMGKVPSYYDWELRFRSDTKSKRKSSKKKKKKRGEKLTSIGIDEQELKYFLKNWKINNLPVKKQK